MKAWPPNPGLTVISSTRSSRSSTYSITFSGVDGLSETPAFLPSSRIACSERSRCSVASACTVMMSHPASAKASRYGSHGSIIRWQSNTLSVRLRIALMTGGPKVMFGTKCPSITSRWIQSAPARTTASTSSPSREKSLDSIDGAISVVLMAGPSCGYARAALHEPQGLRQAPPLSSAGRPRHRGAFAAPHHPGPHIARCAGSRGSP